MAQPAPAAHIGDRRVAQSECSQLSTPSVDDGINDRSVSAVQINVPTIDESVSSARPVLTPRVADEEMQCPADRGLAHDDDGMTDRFPGISLRAYRWGSSSPLPGHRVLTATPSAAVRAAPHVSCRAVFLCFALTGWFEKSAPSARADRRGFVGTQDTQSPRSSNSRCGSIGRYFEAPQRLR